MARQSSTPEKDLQVKLELGVKQKMRDGKRLASDVFRPDAEGKFPVILTRTPYRTAEGFQSSQNEEAIFFARHGYAYVIQDCRGKNDSEGVYRPFQEDDARDGYDTIAWCRGGRSGRTARSGRPAPHTRPGTSGPPPP